jgi:phosphoribosylformylglycinamidine cyclo-ligase
MVQEGDILIGMPSSGVHSNGFSLVRKIINAKGLRFDDRFVMQGQKVKAGKDSGKTLGDVLMEPTRLYFPVANLLKQKSIKIKGMAHITGGGFYENINRIIPENMNVSIEEGSWPIPGIFKYLGTHGNLKKDEMYRVFNMGIGLVIILAPGLAKQAIDILKDFKEKAYQIGQVTGGTGKVIINYKK